MTINHSPAGKEADSILPGTSHHKEALLDWRNELQNEIKNIEIELNRLNHTKNMFCIKIEYFHKWNVSVYSQLRFKVGIELEQMLRKLIKYSRKESL